MRIIADTATLYSPQEGAALGATIIPVGVIINGKSYKDYEEIQCEEFLKMIDAGGVPTSSQPSIGEIIDVFEESREELLLISVGDGLSGAYQNAVGAKNSMEENDHIHVINSKSLAGVQRYILQKALTLKEKGLNIHAIRKELEESIESSLSYVIPEDFEFLKRSGRLTALAAKIGSMIKIVPVLTQTEDKTRITPFVIKRSRKKAIDAIIKHFKNIGIDENYKIYVAHGGAVEKAKEAAEQIKQQLQDTALEVLQLSCALITHGGPGCVVVQVVKK